MHIIEYYFNKSCSGQIVLFMMYNYFAAKNQILHAPDNGASIVPEHSTILLLNGHSETFAMTTN